MDHTKKTHRKAGYILLLLAGTALGDMAASRAFAAEAAQLDTVIVTARKRDENIAKVPESITAFTSVALETYNITSFNDYATKTPNVSFTYGAGPTGISQARTVAVRGITGQNLVGTGGATGFYLDDTPVPGSVDPRVVDIDNVEVLKGPQGTLFGESSLGGNVRLISKSPSFAGATEDFSADVGVTSHGGSADGGASFIGNTVLSPDKLAVRGVLFFDHEAGYLDRTYPNDPNGPGVTNPSLSVPRTAVGDQGAVTTYGGSLSALLRLNEQTQIKFRVLAQDSMDNGFPATFAPLPGFTPDYTIDKAVDAQSKASDVWALPSVELKYKGTGWSLVSSASYFYRATRDREDSTYGTQQILAGYYGVSGLPNQPYEWIGEHSQNQFTSETRLSFDPINGLSGTLGVFYSNAVVRFSIPATTAAGLPAASQTNGVVGPWPDTILWEQENPGSEQDVSLFGELYYKFWDKFNLTLGGREYWLHQRADYTAYGFMNFGATTSDPQHNSESGFDPKVGLSYQATDNAMVYASASEGFRAGGAQAYLDFCALPNLPVNAITQLKSDTLWSYEAGTKIQAPQIGGLLTASVFHIDWNNIQQQVALPCGAYIQVNGKSAEINGGEAEFSGHLAPGLTGRLGIGYEEGTINNPGSLAYAGYTANMPIPSIPKLTATAATSYKHTLWGKYDGFASADVSFTGHSSSVLNGGSGAVYDRPSYTLLNARIGVRWDRSELSLNLHNLGNVKANLGDIGYVGYAQFNAAGSVIPQVATLQPLTATIQYKLSL